MLRRRLKTIIESILFSRKNVRTEIEAYALEGEDLILDRFFHGVNNGFYVDVGAYHPSRFSNTFRFYLRGWRGINVEPNPDAIALFNMLRPRDINLNLSVSNDDNPKTLFCFEEGALNSFDSELSSDREKRGFKIVRKLEVSPFTLSEIFKKYLPESTNIDFLSIDTEGHELEVISSNDWDLYRPRVVLLECNQVGKEKIISLPNALSEATSQIMIKIGYIPFAKTIDNIFFYDGFREIQ